MAKKEKQNSFEENLEKLQEIVDRVDSGELGLEQMIASYEEGLSLIKTCKSILDGAELKINKLVEDSEKTEPFDVQD
ncbi:MAG: Exodeoxyribonuclease 7 small subunit [bacterium ADurb.Bin236]|nr:MAG: Exodeoxyribonuclease 7 small subunit [bacterium ADurb.Bin236]HOY63267.1 exodeoxyribonuclease VII small subunit [bacterium]HPN95136.1 exodeoxyribonuclease VII small subunit [bacterium]